MKMMGQLAVVLVCVCWLAAANLQAESRLMGQQYTLSFTNFPDNLGATEDPEEDRPRTEMDHGTLPAILTFDGIAETAGSMSVNERVFQWEGVPGGIPAEQASGIDGETEFDLIDWEFPGEVVEFSWDTVDGRYISDDEAANSFITVRDITWKNSDPGAEPAFFETGWYMYYTRDGQPLTGYETLLSDIGLLVGAHPFDKNVEEVFYIAYSRGQVEDITLPYEGGFDLTAGTTQLDANASWSLLAETMGLSDEIDGINGFRIGFLVEPPPGEEVPSIRGDFNGDGLLDESDINSLTQQSAGGQHPAAYDLNGDNLVNEADVAEWIGAADIFNSWMGDANLDKEFNSGDLVNVLASGTYEADVDSVWSNGDFNGDGRSNTGDLVLALAGGGYENGPRAAVAAVPEPAAVTLLLLGGMLYAAGRRRN